jgi:predicted NBD/HSP70 family sugar kinase
MGVEGGAIVGRRLTNESNHTAAQAGGLLIVRARLPSNEVLNLFASCRAAK